MASAESKSMDASKGARILNYWRMHLLCGHGAKVLGIIFRERWSVYTTTAVGQQSSSSIRSPSNGQWEDGSECGEALFKLCEGKVSKKMLEKLRKGDSQSWDVTMMGAAIQIISSKFTRKALDGLSKQQWKEQDALIDVVKAVRNDVHHEAVPELSDEQFSISWTSLLDALVGLGADRTELEALRDTMPCSLTPEAASVHPEMARLKEEANREFESKQYRQAIALYSRALKLDGLSNEQRAILYSNRSASHYLIGGEKAMKESIDDAKMSVSSRPEWWKAYYRLGRAYNACQKWKQGISQLETALALNPGAKEVLNELNAARHEYGVISRREHMTPSQQPKTEEEVNEWVAGVKGMSPKVIAQVNQFVESMPDSRGDVKRGHSYLCRVPPDYQEAAKHFAKAAAKGSPEGMYNLALLHKKGLGVPRDFDTAVYWLKKAASTTPTSCPLFSLGIAEAQHSLGLMYNEGVGVEKNYKTAAEWYTKAVGNNSGAAANNLGLFYKNGTGVERSLEKAFQLLQLSARLNDTNGMMNLADCYLAATGTGHAFATSEDKERAIKWLEKAASQGDLDAQQKLDKVKNCGEVDLMILSLCTPMPAEMADPLDHKQHYAAVKLAADKGSPTAKQVLTIWECMKQSWDAFKSGDPKALVTSLSRAIRLDFQNVSIPELFHPMLNDRLMDHPNELESIVCHVAINLKNVHHLSIYVVESNEKFRGDAFLMEICAICLMMLKDFDGALMVLSLALMIHPNSCALLYVRATVLAEMGVGKVKETQDAFNAFLAVAPKDHPKVPAAHYQISYCYGLMKMRGGGTNMADFFRGYEAGLAAEKDQLPCFLPYDFPAKYRLEKMYNMAKLSAGGTNK